jgi:YfiH family protein
LVETTIRLGDAKPAGQRGDKALGVIELAFPPAAADEEPRAWLSLRSEGDMRYGPEGQTANRLRLFAGLGLDPSSVLGAELTHTRRVLICDGDGEALYGPAGPAVGSAAPEHDGIIVADPRLSACVTVADCMPIWILDRHSGAFGVLHSGWKGTGILAVAIEALALRFGSPPEALSVILGPAIGPCCYAVEADRAASFAAEFGREAALKRDGRHYLDLRAANRAIALRRGVGALLSVAACTACEPRLGSYRREGPAAFTRMAAVCGLPGKSA